MRPGTWFATRPGSQATVDSLADFGTADNAEAA